MKSKRVQFSTISDVWKPLEQELKAAQVKPNIKLELGKGKAVKGATTEWIWKQFKRKVSRADYGVSTFIAYTNARNARVASQGCSGGSWAFGEDEPAAPAVPQTPSDGGGAGAGLVNQLHPPGHLPRTVVGGWIG